MVLYREMGEDIIGSKKITIGIVKNSPTATVKCFFSDRVRVILSGTIKDSIS